MPSGRQMGPPLIPLINGVIFIGLATSERKDVGDGKMKTEKIRTQRRRKCDGGVLGLQLPLDHCIIWDDAISSLIFTSHDKLSGRRCL